MDTPARLYIAVRADLAPGPQLAQSVHAAFDFSVKYPELVAAWNRDSNFLVVVAVPDEDALFDLSNAAIRAGMKFTEVEEPDYDYSLTAVALEPGTIARQLCAQFPLALKEKRPVPV